MTQDQIKAIAEEYTKHKVIQKYVWKFSTDSDLRAAIQAEATKLLQYLSTRYCIVEREKVMEMYNSLKTPDNPLVDPKPTCVARIVLTTLFGTSMFNQNEE